MQYLIDHARSCGLVRLGLYVREDNARARALYESLGFHDDTRWPAWPRFFGIDIDDSRLRDR